MRNKDIEDFNLLKTYLKNYYENEKIHPVNQKYDAIEGFKGYIKERGHTDIIFLLIFIFVLISGIALFSFSFLRFNFEIYFQGQDFRADICGLYPLENRKLLYFNNPKDWGIKVSSCVEKCPVEVNKEICLYNRDNTNELFDYCSLTYVTTIKNNICLPSGERAIDLENQRIIFNFLYYDFRNIFIKLSKDIYIFKEYIVIIFFINFILSTVINILFNISKFGFNKIIYFICLFGTILFSFLNFFLNNQLEAKINNGCSKFNLTYCFPLSKYSLHAISYITFVLVTIVVIKHLIKIKSILFNFKILGNFKDSYFRANVFFGLFIIMLINIFLTAIFIGLLLIVSVSGFNRYTNAGEGFFAKQVRETFYGAYHYLAFCFIIITIIIVINIINIYNKTVMTSFVSQYYFYRDKYYLKKTLYPALSFSFYHFGSFIKHFFIFLIAYPLIFVLRPIRKNIDKRILATKYTLYWIKSIKPLMWIYNELKYYHTSLFNHISLFGEAYTISSIKFYYLRWRNWDRFKKFDNNLGYFTEINRLVCFLISYFCTLNILVYYNQSIFQVNFTFDDITYFPILIIITNLLSSLVNKGISSLIEYGNEAYLFCFVCDEEMFEGTQRFVEDHIKLFFNEFSKEAERDYLKNVFNQDLVKNEDNEDKKKLINSKFKKKNKVHDLKKRQTQKKLGTFKNFDENHLNLQDIINNQDKDILSSGKKDSNNTSSRRIKKEKTKIKINENSAAGNLLKNLKKKPVEKVRGELLVEINNKDDNENNYENN